MKLIKEFYSKLDSDKTQINWNKNPIKMKDFLSFLTIPVTMLHNQLGSSNGWTYYENTDYSLQVKGGIVPPTEYLDSIQFGKKLSNSYNNYVNPFFLFDILTEEGKKFFINYYSEDILKLLDKQNNNVNNLKSILSVEESLLKELENEVNYLNQLSGNTLI